MHQSTTPSLSQTIWPRWASRQFLSFPIDQTLLPVILLIPFAQRLSLWDNWGDESAVTKVIDTLTQEDFHGAFQKLLERYNKYITAGVDYFEGD